MESFGEVNDPGFVLVEGKPPGFKPPGQPGSDLLSLLPGVTARHQIIGVPDQHRAARHRFSGASAGVVADPGGLLQPVQRDVQEQRTDHAALWRSLLGRREALARLDHPRLQPIGDHSPGGEVPDHP